MKSHPNWYTCGITAQAIRNILCIKGEFSQIYLRDVIPQLDSGRLITIELRPCNYYEESHIFSCVKYNNKYCILDSYIKCKPFEIRYYDRVSFSKILCDLLGEMDEKFWRYISNIPKDTKINLSRSYLILIMSYPSNSISLKNFMDKHSK